jgi:hypothetical protein
VNAREQLLALPFNQELAPGARNAVEHWTNDLKQVVDYMITETEHGLFAGAAQ